MSGGEGGRDERRERNGDTKQRNNYTICVDEELVNNNKNIVNWNRKQHLDYKVSLRQFSLVKAEVFLNNDLKVVS